MNDEVIEDLKQFITATVVQHTSHLATKDDLMGVEQRLDSKIDRLDERLTQQIDQVHVSINQLSTDIADALTQSNDAHGDQLKNHETRISKLEAKVA